MVDYQFPQQDSKPLVKCAHEMINVSYNIMVKLDNVTYAA